MSSESTVVEIDGYNLLPPVGSSDPIWVKSLKDYGIVLDVFFAGVPAGYLTNWAKGMGSEGSWGNFAARHVIPSYGSGIAFAFVGSASRFMIKFHEAKKQNPHLTFSDYANKENMFETFTFFLNVIALGGTAFGSFTSAVELLSIGVNPLVANAAGFALGMIVFSVGNYLAGALQSYIHNEETAPLMPWDVLTKIAGVLIGFGAGGYGVQQIAALKIVSDSVLNNAVAPLLPTATGIGGGVLGSWINQAVSFGSNRYNSWSSAQNNMGYQPVPINEEADEISNDEVIDFDCGKIFSSNNCFG